MAACHGSPDRAAWLERLPRVIGELRGRWSLTLGTPWAEAGCAWVAPALRRDGARVVLKLGMPHMEGAHEIEGLRVWAGEPTVRLLEADDDLNAMLLERCEPGTSLRDRAEPEQDAIVAGLLRCLWRTPPAPHRFRPLAMLMAHWKAETLAGMPRWSDAGLVRAGLRILDELATPAPDDVLLATDLHAGNVLRAQREPWLAIDPKPFVGDRAFDATQHLLNCHARVLAAPDASIRRLADLLEVDWERVRLWLFARAAAGPREVWEDEGVALARTLGKS